MTIDTQWVPHFRPQVHRFDLWVLCVAFLVCAVFVGTSWRNDGGGWFR